MKIKPHQKFEGISFAGHGDQYRLYTKNRDKGHIVYGERLIIEGDTEFREWNPYRSKLAASIMNKARNIYIDKNSTVLYLGASSGTTVSHVSDLTNNTIYAIEFALSGMKSRWSGLSMSMLCALGVISVRGLLSW